MANFRCYKCGFETPNVGDFMGTQGNGDHHWTIFICPQCSRPNPPVAEISHDAGFKLQTWLLVEADDGLRVTTGCLCTPIHAKHPLLDAPASVLRPELEGTLRDHGNRLREVGRANARQFHDECDQWRRDNPGYKPDDLRAAMDESRQRNQVGPHAPRVEHDGATIMRKAGLMGRY